jgi:hypothetical protein
MLISLSSLKTVRTSVASTPDNLLFADQGVFVP